MRTNTQEAVLSAYIASIGKRTPRDAAQDAADLCRFATSLNRLNGIACNVGLTDRQERLETSGYDIPVGEIEAGMELHRPCLNRLPYPHVRVRGANGPSDPEFLHEILYLCTRMRRSTLFSVTEDIE
jgi:hypothetical protein